MLSHRRLSAWYRQLAQQLEAGLLLADALRSSRGTGLPETGLVAMAGAIEQGGSIDDAFRMAGPWLPLSDRLVLSASAEAGRMPRTLQGLATRHAQLGAAKLRLLLACLYPLGILHLGLLLLPVTRMIDWEKGFTWDTAAYVRGVAFTILPLWALIAIVVALAQRQSVLLRRVAGLLPFVRGYLREQALADFAFILGNFLDAGLPIDRAWATAGVITPAPELKTAAAAMGPVIARGEQPGTRLAAWPCFPGEFVALYRTGETSGQLEQNLLRLATQHQERASRALGLATLFYPALMFIAVAVAVVIQVVSIYAGYLKMLEKLATP